MLLKWKDDFAIDHGIIDEDHQFLFRKLNTIIRRLNHQIPVQLIIETIRQVRDFAAVHFEREERLQEMVDYPDLPHHRAEHIALLAQLDAVIEHLASLPEQAAIDDSQGMKMFFYDWMLGHIIGSDRMIAPYVKSTRSFTDRAHGGMSPAKEGSLHERDWA